MHSSSSETRGARFATVYDERGGELAAVVDRTGAVHAELAWAGGQLIRLQVAGATVDGAVIDHPLLGPAHTVGETAMSRLDWARPTEIPAIAEPGRLPLGAGAAIMNTIALLAQRAGVQQLRYAGPYPTAALWRTLLRSFRCHAGEAAFTTGGLDRAIRLARDPLPIDFAPAPHERIAIDGGFVELREQPGGTIDRAVISGVSYEPNGSPGRLVSTGEAGAVAAEIWFGDAPYARLATLSADGSLLDGPHPLPACTSGVIGRAFPPPLVAALAELIAGAVPRPLADDARALAAGSPVHWADLGARVAAEAGDGFAVHAALWDRIAPLGMPRLAFALVEALAPVITVALVRRASRAIAAARDTVAPPSTRGL